MVRRREMVLRWPAGDPDARLPLQEFDERAAASVLTPTALARFISAPPRLSSLKSLSFWSKPEAHEDACSHDAGCRLAPIRHRQHNRELRRALAAALRGPLRELRVDDWVSPFGGLTDLLAWELAADMHRAGESLVPPSPLSPYPRQVSPSLNPSRVPIGCQASGLEALELSFVPYSPSAARFTDEGLSTLLGVTPRLRRLVLRGCSSVTDRSLYALAACCPGLEELELLGYSEEMHGWAIATLAESCPRLRSGSLMDPLCSCPVDSSAKPPRCSRRLVLHRKLPRVGDEMVPALLANVAAQLQHVALPSTVSAGAVETLAAGCPVLSTLDVSACQVGLACPF